MKKIPFLFLFTACISNAAFAEEENPSVIQQQFKIICEGEKSFLKCEAGEQLKIKRVFWGRDDFKECTHVPAGLTLERLCEANSDNATQKVEGQCKNEQECEIVASNIFFDDNSCGNVYKYLKVYSECLPTENE